MPCVLLSLHSAVLSAKVVVSYGQAAAHPWRLPHSQTKAEELPADAAANLVCDREAWRGGVSVSGYLKEC